MNTDLFVESSFSLTPNDVLQDRHHGRIDINYWIGDGAEPSVVFVTIDAKEPQIIGLDWQDITYGKKAYFLCSCGVRVLKLHLPLHGKEFKCRTCHGLHYELTTYNRYSIAGMKLYQLNRLNKLSNNRAGMSRIFYNGEYTKRFERFLGQCERAGFNSIVDGANALKQLVHG